MSRQTNRWPFRGGRTKAIVCGYGDVVTLILCGLKVKVRPSVVLGRGTGLMG